MMYSGPKRSALPARRRPPRPSLVLAAPSIASASAAAIFLASLMVEALHVERSREDEGEPRALVDPGSKVRPAPVR